VFLKDPGMRNVLGGSDPYTMSSTRSGGRSELKWGTAMLDWRGADLRLGGIGPPRRPEDTTR